MRNALVRLDLPAARRTLTASRTKDWSGALRSAAITGALAAGTTGASLMLAGVHDSASAAAPINATSHIVWGERAGQVERVDAKHTLLGGVIHLSACIFWAAIYEKVFGRAAERGDLSTSLLGAAAVATAAYVTDYHVVPERLTPGWEQHLSRPSLTVVYVVLALTFPLRGIVRRARKYLT